MTSVHFSHQHHCLLYCVSHQNVNGVNCSQNLKHLLKTNLYLTAWCLIDCDGVARYLDVMFTGQTEEKEGRETNTGRSFKPIKEKQMIQTLNCIKQCDTATCFLSFSGNYRNFLHHTDFPLKLWAVFRCQRSSVLGCRLRRIMSSSSELFGWAQTDKWTEQKSAALCDVCETFNTCMLTHTHNYITACCVLTLWLCSYTYPVSNVLANAFSLPFLICKTILAHLDKSFNVGKMPSFPNWSSTPTSFPSVSPSLRLALFLLLCVSHHDRRTEISPERTLPLKVLIHIEYVEEEFAVWIFRTIYMQFSGFD